MEKKCVAVPRLSMLAMPRLIAAKISFENSSDSECHVQYLSLSKFKLFTRNYNHAQIQGKHINSLKHMKFMLCLVITKMCINGGVVK